MQRIILWLLQIFIEYRALHASTHQWKILVCVTPPGLVGACSSKQTRVLEVTLLCSSESFLSVRLSPGHTDRTVLTTHLRLVTTMDCQYFIFHSSQCCGNSDNICPRSKTAVIHKLYSLILMQILIKK